VITQKVSGHRVRIITLLIAALFLSGCGNPSPFMKLSEGTCTSQQKQQVTDHILGQIKALAAGNFKGAYEYAAKSFQENVDLEQFSLIISNQYQMLISYEDITFVECLVEQQTLVQDVDVVSRDGNFTLSYQLSVEDNKLGVLGAIIKSKSSDLNL
jgi:PBP1b-binding outer membrane lipoprotein LpoB